VRAVLQVFSAVERHRDDETLQALAAIGAQLGALVERQEAQSAREMGNLHDPVTDLPNGMLLTQRADAALRAARRGGVSMSLLIVDLDDFKDVNETFGRETGDLVLRQVAGRLRAAVRQTDTVARLSGDEFAVLLHGTDGTGAAAATEKFLRILQEPYTIQDQSIEVGVTAGIAVAPEHGEQAASLLRHADFAMQAARRGGRPFATYSAESEAGPPNRLLLVRDLRQAVDRKQLLLHYLPVVNIKSGAIEGVEAVLRWNHPDHGLLTGDTIVAIAENTGLMQTVGTYVLEMALQQSRAWHDTGVTAPITVRLWSRRLQDPQFPETLAALLAQWNVKPGWIELAVASSSVTAGSAHVDDVLKRLAAMGIGICMEGLGAGSASVAHLHHLRLTKLKIDRTYVHDLAGNEEHAAIVRSALELAHALGMRAVADGVDSSAVWRSLEAMGCDLAQGQYLSDPLAPLEFVRRYGKDGKSSAPRLAM
jgi:diguanylate cyclase (GGDEF)-like protein